jgi:hypothetical protein
MIGLFSAGRIVMGRNMRFRAVIVALAAVSATVPTVGAAPAVRKAKVKVSSALPRTPWGDPNLEGVWSSGPMSDVPFERAAEWGTRAVLTAEEFAARVAAHRAQVEIDREAFLRPGANEGVISQTTDWRSAERGKPSLQASLIADPPDGRLPPLTEEGARRARLWQDTASHPAGPEELNPYDRCITRGVLGSIFPNFYNSAAQIFQTPSAVVIHYEMIHDTRVIPIDGRPHGSPAIRSYMGDARGHWEGATLVVETTNFNGQTGSYGRNGNGNPTSQQLRLIERFRMTDRDTLQYQVRVDDPQTYTGPWTVAFPLARAENYRIYEYACHEGNYALVNILSATRATERLPVP